MFGWSTSARNRELGPDHVDVLVAEQALEHHPPADLQVAGEVDPAETAVGEAALHFVLRTDDGLPARAWA